MGSENSSKVSGKRKLDNMEFSQLVKETFNNSPVSRLFLHSGKSKNFICPRSTHQF